MILCTRNIPLHIQSGVMILTDIRTAGKLIHSLKGAVIQNGEISFQFNRPDISCLKTAFFGNDCRMDVAVQIVCELGFIGLKVAADKQHNIMVITIALIDNRLAGRLFLTMQEITNLLNGVNVRRMYQGEFPGSIASFVLNNTLRRLHVGTVIAFRTDRNRIFTDRGKQHKFMGNITAHHTGVGSHRNHLRQACPCIDALISLMALRIILLQIFLTGVE